MRCEKKKKEKEPPNRAPTAARIFMVLCSAACKKWGSLGTVVLQNTALYLTAHASLRPVGSPQYLGTVAVLLTELLKAAVCVVCVVAESDWSGLTAALRDEPRSLMAFAVPAACYSIHNNLWYVAVANLDPVTIAVTTQFKIVFAALFSRLLLGHRLDALRCCAVATLVAGSILLQVSRRPTPTPPPSQSAAGGVLGDRFTARASVGLAAMAGVCALSGFAGAFTERLLKDKSRASSLWMRNVQMALFSTPFAAAGVLLADGEALRTHGPWVGFNWWLVATIVLGAIGGLAVSLVFKFADNILKAFAVGCSIALTTVLSFACFGVVLDGRGWAGVGLVTAASITYNLGPCLSRAADGGGVTEDETEVGGDAASYQQLLPPAVEE